MEVLSTLLAIGTGITGLISMFWQPSFSPAYKPALRYKPTKIERYIRYINRMLDEAHYDLVADLLSRTKYSKDDLPWESWKEQVQEELVRVERESKQLTHIRNLEKILDS